MGTFREGKNSRVCLNTYASVLAGMGRFTVDMGRDVIDGSEFGTEWKRTTGGQIGARVTFEGFYDKSNVSVSGILSAFLAGSLLTTLRLYEDSASYWAADTVVDADAGFRVTAFNVSSANNELVRVNCTCESSGAIARTAS